MAPLGCPPRGPRTATRQLPDCGLPTKHGEGGSGGFPPGSQLAAGHCLAAGRWIQHYPRSAGPFSALFAPGRRTQPGLLARKAKGGHCFAAGRLDPALLSVGEYFLLSRGGYFLLALLTTHPIALWPITTVTATVYLMISQYLAHKHAEEDFS